jgi:cytochrome b pre-mRNA-processing protein 3
MDHNLREMGISYIKVPKEMQRIGEAFYGRAQAYREALAAGEAALAEAVARNIYAGTPPAPDLAPRLAAYMRLAVLDLAAQGAESLAAGDLRFPDPAAIPAATA